MGQTQRLVDVPCPCPAWHVVRDDHAEQCCTSHWLQFLTAGAGFLFYIPALQCLTFMGEPYL